MSEPNISRSMRASWDAIIARIEAALDTRIEPDSATPVSGGCINSAWRLRGSNADVFVKTNAPETYDMFVAEADGLRELAAAGGVRVPGVYAVGIDGATAWLALEWIGTGRVRGATERLLGDGLAILHRCRAEQFGWTRDNTIGSTPQRNTRGDDWAQFFAEHRLGFQLDLAERGGWPASMVDAGRRLQERLAAFFSTYRPIPSLLHGDLWGGNWAADADGRPFIFDPAVYYGDREADLAMTELFGGFGGDFYAAYNAAWLTDPGYGKRRDLYNLYHVLNHLNLFGAGYLARAKQTVRRLLAELG